MLNPYANVDARSMTPTKTPGVTYFGAYHRPPDGHFYHYYYDIIAIPGKEPTLSPTEPDNPLNFLSLTTASIVFMPLMLLLSLLPLPS